MPPDPSVHENPAAIAAEVDPGERASVSVAVVDQQGEMTVRDVPVQGPQQAAAAVSKAQRDGATVAVGIAAPLDLLATSSDPRRSQQWSLDTLGAEQSWRVSTGRGQVVAVVDSGVQSNHPDLRGHVLPGVDLTKSTALRTSVDPIGHGTHVAGTIAAVTHNGLGIAGMAPDARILPVKVLDDYGHGTTQDLASGIAWAANHGATVINISLGTTIGTDPTLRAAVKYAVGKGVPIVAAAGNWRESGSPRTYPGAFDEVIAVAATDGRGATTGYSNIGNYVDVAAPGDQILSTYNNGDYDVLSGTSMAAPHVSAIVAQLRQVTPRATPVSLQQWLERTATDIGAPGRDNAAGSGLVNPSGALGMQPTGLAGPPRFTMQPASTAVRFGAKLSISATVSGARFLQWQKLGSRGWQNIPGASRSTLSFGSATTAMAGGYRLVAVNGRGSAISRPVIVAVLTPPTVTKQPSSTGVRTGALVALTAAASGSPAPSIQWQRSVDGGRSWVNIPRATSPSLQFRATMTASGQVRYRAVFRNSQGAAVTRSVTVSVAG